MSSKIPSKMIFESGGIKLRVSKAGTGDIPCVFIHGLGDGGFVWEDFVKEVSPYFETLVVDLRGHGDSDWDNNKNYKFEDFVSDVEFIIDRLGLKNYILLGHSLGGSVAADIMARRPDEVQAAVLVDAGPLSDPAVREYLRKHLIESYKSYATLQEYINWVQEERPLISYEAAEALAIKSLRKLSSGSYYPKYDIAAVNLPLADENWWWEKLPHFEIPILLVRGTGSAVLSTAVAKEMLRLLPKGELVSVEMAGHAVMTDNFAGFKKSVLPFLMALRRVN